MIRLFVSEALSVGQVINLTEKQHHYVLQYDH